MKSVVTLILCGLLAGTAHAGPAVSIIIDDLGNRGGMDRRAADLPGPVAVAVLPGTPFSRDVAERAHRSGKEVLVHLPMQSQRAMDTPRGTINLRTTRRELERTLEQALDAVPYVRGINNHQGSLITRHPGHMDWLMAALARHENLFFVDSRTTHLTVAERIAREHRVPVLARDVFLDDDPSPRAVTAAFDELLDIARRRGRAVAIGHPNETTLAVLEARLPALEKAGVELISLGEMLKRIESEDAWPAYSSR